MEKEQISTLETPNLTSIRCDGNTTRQVDFAIQKLFQGFEVIIEDHYSIYDKASAHRVNSMLFHRIMDRLKNNIKEYRLSLDKIASYKGTRSGKTIICLK